MLFEIRAFDTRKLDSLFLNQFDQSIHVFKEKRKNLIMNKSENIIIEKFYSKLNVKLIL